jgi:hypothetical protein
MSDQPTEKTPYHSFVVKQGIVFRKAIRFSYSLVGYGARFSFRPVNSSTSILIDSTAFPVDPAKNVTVDVVENEVTIFMSAGTTDAFDWREAGYRFELVAPGGEAERKLLGVLSLEAKIG